MKINFDKSFEKQMMKFGLLPNIISGIIVMPYIFCFAGVKFSQFPISFFYGMLIMFVIQTIIAPQTNRLITNSVSKRFEDWKYDNNYFSVADRTNLLKDLLKIPFYISLQVFLLFFVGCILWIFILYFQGKFEFKNLIYGCVATIFTSTISGLFTLDMAEKVCSNYAKPLVAQGIKPNDEYEKFGYGLSIKKLFVFYILVPLIISFCLLFFLVWSSFTSEINSFLQTDSQNSLNNSLRILLIFAIHLFLISVLSILFFNKISLHAKEMRIAIKNINTQGADSVSLLPCDFTNELSYNVFWVNSTISLFKNIFENTNSIAQKVSSSNEDLLLSVRNVETISIEQSNSVKNIVTTMEESDKLSQSISKRINEVALVANKTALDVQEGVEILATNLAKMEEITNANVDTISGIKLLSEKIENIWEIVTIINGIADQTKVIALNAELEAVSAGEAGKNFHIVANEIRRLADGITESIKEIREKITEIQHSSDNLIIASEGGTEKILEGCDLSTKLKKNFADIKSSAEVTAESSADISLIIGQQATAFEQILVTLRQISISIENNSELNQTITKTCEELHNIVNRLKFA